MRQISPRQFQVVEAIQTDHSEKLASIWLYKGGGACFHYFKRQVFKTSLRGAKSDISDRQLISSAKAISEGFTIEQEDSKVAQAPRTMPNEGFINK